ncbi:MAG: HAMP domain-containing protein [Pleurocapsa sp. SU_196_0]|nr:HAMP domain-containing protein [Pleurocapsa sp. SU_196_0]
MALEMQPSASLHEPTTHRVVAWWRELGLGKKLDIIIISALLPIVIITVWMGGIAKNTENRTVVTAGQRNVTFTSYELQLAILDIETGYRGYALSSNEAFLEPYDTGIKNAAASLNRLDELGLFPEQVRDLRSSIENFKAWTVTTVALGRAGESLSGAVERALYNDGKRRMDDLRQKLVRLRTASFDAFNQSRTQTVQDIAALTYLPWGIFAIVIIGAFTVRTGLRHFVVKPLEQLEGAAQRLASGDADLHLSVPGDDELGKLAQTFKQTAHILRARTDDLERSNHELEQFAYVASHDLQEPLRMVSSYTQLLSKRYKGKLDDKADMYIHYAVDGASRMQALIQDLLAYSRVGTKRDPLEPVDAGAVVRDVVKSLEVAISDHTVNLEVGALPTIMADRVQLNQVFQNLIGNALKFRREGVQHLVQVCAKADGDFWQFTVRDNGIGINPDYFERIFVIFQRLHTRETFSGSGIGLAIVKKIVERHGGRIWVESEPDKGSSFHFTFRAVGKES